MDSFGPLIDIGVNLTNSRFAKDCGEVLLRAQQSDVRGCILTGTSIKSSLDALELCRQYRQQWPGMLFSTAGVHPHEASCFDESTTKTLRQMIVDNSSLIVAVGECGLDFNRNFSPPDAQRKAFAAQIELACEIGLPLFLHERDAHRAQIDILKYYANHWPKAVLHCFTGDRQTLYNYLDMGLSIGITGWICDQQRGADLRACVKDIPIDQLMVETDAPFLLPKTLDSPPKNKRNEPVFLPAVVAMLARCRQQDTAEIAAASYENAVNFFNLAEKLQRPGQ